MGGNISHNYTVKVSIEMVMFYAAHLHNVKLLVCV